MPLLVAYIFKKKSSFCKEVLFPFFAPHKSLTYKSDSQSGIHWGLFFSGMNLCSKRFLENLKQQKERDILMRRGRSSTVIISGFHFLKCCRRDFSQRGVAEDDLSFCTTYTRWHSI
eukprot:TRINITY_DN1285_c0_g1_i1.p2 TRINITY_DN1285_c0_g1~~TRINITY_DN1285_c0_g1_i1.p2  ORF type:complete len:116 (+),score=5.77 TRINITY_DN1285_c0_g1_i1:603-950(+)